MSVEVRGGGERNSEGGSLTCTNSLYYGEQLLDIDGV